MVSSRFSLQSIHWKHFWAWCWICPTGFGLLAVPSVIHCCEVSWSDRLLAGHLYFVWGPVLLQNLCTMTFKPIITHTYIYICILCVIIHFYLDYVLVYIYVHTYYSISRYFTYRSSKQTNIFCLDSQAFKTHAKHAALADDTGNPIRKAAGDREISTPTDDMGKSQGNVWNMHNMQHIYLVDGFKHVLLFHTLGIIISTD